MWLALGLLTLLAGCLGAYRRYTAGRPAPIPYRHEYFHGVTYYRRVRYAPHWMVAHILVLDRRAADARFLVTPPDFREGPPLRARTTSQFLQEFGVQIAINGDGFHPWWSHNPADYYPHVGDPVTPNGYAASHGRAYSDGSEPTLYISRRNELTFLRRPGNVHGAISGERMLVLQGEPVAGLDDVERHPRTAVGLNRNGRFVILIVVDGRQPFYSEGATLLELARLLIKEGAYMAMNLDGGGSSTMVIEGQDGRPRLLNSPIDLYIPGRERAVANHLGVYLGK